MALQQGIYGVVRVRVDLDPSGAVRNAVVVSSPSRVLILESLRAARATTFAPARRHCVRVASAYDFRVLYAEDGPHAPLAPGPSPSPSPTPLPKPDLGKPWRLDWSTSNFSSFTERTVTSTGAYAQLFNAPLASRRSECRDMLAPPAVDRVNAALRAARPETWRDDYFGLAADPTLAPSSASTRTPRPAVDVVAVVRESGYAPVVADAPNGTFVLTADSLTYRVRYEYGVLPGVRETFPSEIRGLANALDAATPERCMQRR